MTRRAPLQITTWGRFRRDLGRSGRAYLREHGRFRELVLPQIRAGRDPSPEDIAGALREAAPDVDAIARVTLSPEEHANLVDDPPADMPEWMRAHISEDRWAAARALARQAITTDTATLCDYVARTYVLGRPRKPGPKPRTDTHTLTDDNRIALEYFGEVRRLQAAREADSRRSRAVKTQAKKRVAKRHGISTSTLERLVRDLSVRIS